MRADSPIFLWRRASSRVWLAQNEAALRAVTPLGFAVIEKPARERLLVEASCPTRTVAQRLVRQFGGTIEKLPGDWLAQFAQSQQADPIRIGRRLLIASAPLKNRDRDARVLVIPHSVAFGTGEHATTAMSLRMLERSTRTQPAAWRMLDAGTGSGILALAGCCFGAGDVLAIDNDPLALSTAQANARANNVRGVTFRLQDVKRALAGRFDVITANLYSELLREVLPRFRKALARDGVLILSGVMRKQERDLASALREAGFTIMETRRRGKWVALRCVSARARAGTRSEKRG